MPHPDPRLQRLNRLQQTVHYASLWLIGQGLLFCLLGDRSARWLRLRFDPEMTPYLDLAGLGLLCLGLFINRAVREASKQYLAVDTLTLFFSASAAMILAHRFRGFPLFWFEWASLLVNLGFGGALIAYRTKGTQMDAPGALVALDVKDAWTQALDLAKGWRDGRAAKPALPEAAAAPEAPAPIEAAIAPAAPANVEVPPEKPKPISQAMPHLD